MTDQIRYDLLTQQALRGVVRGVLTDAAKKGLPGDHHFYIAFDTRAEGVRMSQRLRTQYPEEMTIILQHQFWDLTVDEDGFEVGLSFGGIPEKLSIPFEAINGFFDPSVQFGLQFEEVTEGQDARAAPAIGQENSADTTKKKRRPSSVPNVPPPAPPSPAKTPAKTAAAPKVEKADKPDLPDKSDLPDLPDKPSGGGGEVVRLDRFRKK
jgi:uncharacterized protein